MSAGYSEFRRAGLSHDDAKRAEFAERVGAVRVHIANGGYDTPTSSLAALVLALVEQGRPPTVAAGVVWFSASDEEPPAASAESPSTSPGETSLG